MGIQLNETDFNRLAGIVAAMPEFRAAASRIDFLDDVFAGSPRQQDLLGHINVDGTPRGVAVRVIARLTQFGQDDPGRETLGVLINKLLVYIGGGEDADFLRGLFDRYPLAIKPAAARALVGWRGHESPADVQEKVIGENTLRHVRMLEQALEASRAVVRIATMTDLGSGFLAGPNLIMTNHHVIDSNPAARYAEITFNYQLDKEGREVETTTTGVPPEGLFYSNPELDVTVVEIAKAPDDVRPLLLAPLPVRRDERVNIIQHPGGHYKKFSMQNNFVAYADARTIQYLTTTEPGSSGSPVFNNDFLVVGIHHSGGELLEPSTNRRYLRNAGSSMTAVLADLRDNAPQIYERLNIQ